MNIPIKQKVISKLQEHFKTQLNKLTNKQIMYDGKLPNGKRVLICTPQSRLHADGKGWVDITAIQVRLFKEVDHAVLAIRIEGNKEYYVSFESLQPYLTKSSMYNNSREGDHWKLYIWPNEIQVLGNKSRLHITQNNLDILTSSV